MLPSPATLRRRLSQDPDSSRLTSARLLVPDALGVEESKAGSQPRRGATAGANANGTANANANGGGAPVGKRVDAEADARVSELRKALVHLYRFHNVLRFAYVHMYFRDASRRSTKRPANTSGDGDDYDMLQYLIAELEGGIEYLFSLTDTTSVPLHSMDVDSIKSVLRSCPAVLDHDLTTAAVWPQIVDGVHRGHGDSAHRPYHDASSLEVNQGATESEANLPFVCENVNKIQQYVIVLRSRNRRLPRKHTSLCCCALQALVLYSRIRTYTPLPCRNVAAAAAVTAMTTCGETTGRVHASTSRAKARRRRSDRVMAMSLAVHAQSRECGLLMTSSSVSSTASSCCWCCAPMPCACVGWLR